MSLTEEYRLKRDLVLPLGRVTVLPVTLSGDLQTIMGVPNVQEAIKRRIITETASMTYRRDYGVGGLQTVGMSPTSTNLQAFATRLQRNVLKEPRLENTTLSLGPGRLSNDLYGLTVQLSAKILAEEKTAEIVLEVAT